jgi:molybdenum cofactor guanylyltransferase
MNALYPVTAILLAGGKGVRIGGNKGRQLLQGRPLVDWVLDAVKPQCAAVLISANENADAYAGSGFPVIADMLPDWQGPLAGLHAGMQHAATDFVLTVPCDTPFLPHDLVANLMQGLKEMEAAVAVTEGRRQPAIALYRRNVLPKLESYLATGKRKVSDWLDTLSLSEASFPDPEYFNNINTLDELGAASEYASTYLHEVKKV